MLDFPTMPQYISFDYPRRRFYGNRNHCLHRAVGDPDFCRIQAPLNKSLADIWDSHAPTSLGLSGAFLLIIT